MTPNRNLTNPQTGPEWRFIISDWISDNSIFDKSLGGRSKSEEGVDLAPFFPRLILLVHDVVVEVIDDVDLSLSSLCESDKFAILGKDEG